MIPKRVFTAPSLPDRLVTSPHLRHSRGGGLYLIYAEKKALREKSQALLDFTRDHARFFLLVTMVFGSITGVGIWFIKPSETRLYFVSNQKVHPSGQQIFPQLLRCRAFAVAYYGFMPGASTCEKLC